jgi:NADH-quinone oxidoreductase B subunit
VALVDRLGKALDRGGEKAPVILTTLDAVLDFARGQSVWTHPMGTACCAMEFIAASFSKFDFDRLGSFPRPDPRHVDCMVVAGTITKKMAPAIQRLYDQLAEPRWVIAMGNCAVSGGIFHYDSYSVIRGVDEFLPVDVYISGCPPRPESLEDAVLQLRAKIRNESISEERRYGHETLLPGLDDPRKGDLAAERAAAGEESAGEGS